MQKLERVPHADTAYEFIIVYEFVGGETLSSLHPNKIAERVFAIDQFLNLLRFE